MKIIFPIMDDRTALYLSIALRTALYSAVTAATSYTLATETKDWSDQTHDEHVRIFVMMFVAWGGAMISFFDSAVKKLSGEKPEPLPDKPRITPNSEPPASV